MESSESAADTAENKEKETNPRLIAWECFSLSMEEFLHALELYLKNKNGKPLGHR